VLAEARRQCGAGPPGGAPAVRVFEYLKKPA
jgi:hypothetical protein